MTQKGNSRQATERDEDQYLNSAIPETDLYETGPCLETEEDPRILYGLTRELSQPKLEE